MKKVKIIFVYSLWVVVSLLLGIGYMRMVLGTNETSTEGLWYLLHVFYDFGLFYTGLAVGSIVALLFILLDVFYLKKKLKKNRQAMITRFLFLVIITMFVGLAHYILEKVIDVI